LKERAISEQFTIALVRAATPIDIKPKLMRRLLVQPPQQGCLAA